MLGFYFYFCKFFYKIEKKRDLLGMLPDLFENHKSKNQQNIFY